MTDRRTYVLDTSVLLSDPWAIMRFAEHEVVVPLVVISELEAKRHHHELGWFARQALRLFDDLRKQVSGYRHIPDGVEIGDTADYWPEDRNLIGLEATEASKGRYGPERRRRVFP